MDTSQYRDMFVQEAREHVQNLNEFLLKLEREPAEKEYVNTLFRSRSEEHTSELQSH